MSWQNGFGATFQQRELTWQNKAGTIGHVHRFAATVEKGMLYVGTKNDQQRMSGDRAKKGKDL
jgi:hypothetical protein